MASRIDFAFPLPLGLHARPASALCDIAVSLGSRITLTNHRTCRQASARSALALVATLTRHGDACTLLVAGEDEVAACERLQHFIDDEWARCDDQVPAAPAAREGVRSLPRALASSRARILEGTPVSAGIARAVAFVLEPWLDALPLAELQQGSVAEETDKLDRAMRRVDTDNGERQRHAVHETERAILAAHRSILEDEEWRGRIEAEIRSGRGAVQAVVAAAEHFAGILRESGSTYLQERALDLREIAAQIVGELAGGTRATPAMTLDAAAICIAPSLGPTQLISLDRQHLKGIALSQGGATSHTAILARAFGIPCVVGVAGVERLVPGGREVIVDGERGLVIAEPTPAVLAFYEAETRKLEAMRARARAFGAEPGLTADGRRLEVAANVGSLDEVRLAFEHGAEGIGLFRTELLFMGRDAPPSEVEQLEVYAETARLAAGRPVIIRTLDIGGDKPIPYLGLPPEANPFLGFRAVRMYAAHPGIIEAQVRAILRASAVGPLKIMLPMVCCLEEVRAFRALVTRLQAELASEGVAHDPAIEVGIMVEIPSVAFVVDQLAHEVDFFSIGSNDLAQYFLAVDRDNPAVAHLYSPFHPAFLRLLEKIVTDAHRHQKWVGICGELGGNVLAAPLLVSLGLDELSLASPNVATMKAAIRGCEMADCRELLAAAGQASNAADVEALLRAFAEARKDRSLSAADIVHLGSGSHTRDEAIKELVDLLHLAGRVDDPDAVEAALWRREETTSTGVGFGVAIPHCRSPHVGIDSIAVLTFATGIDWASLDGEPVEMAILIALREEAGGDAHLRMIAALSRRLMDDEFRNALLAARDASEIVARLLQTGDEGGR
ncbi:MAG TPA: phosphoenolpyruvate--protein phosphotransferase [Thermoanaerobaculaceae bacterium]|nr:phosphoenolpyruvate--protein phosphotransferase [Thermoanaerobaculaceae bacterium]HPS78987.1 phosphoenolpyruvate--protein phosphotransferase [Thermoanaerobaculaceae bacterium]